MTVDLSAYKKQEAEALEAERKREAARKKKAMFMDEEGDFMANLEKGLSSTTNTGDLMKVCVLYVCVCVWTYIYFIKIELSI